MKTVYEVQEYIQRLADMKGYSPIFVKSPMYRLKYKSCHITIRFGKYNKTRSFSSQVKLRNYINKNIDLLSDIRHCQIEIEGPFTLQDYNNIHNNQKESKTIFPSLRTKIFNRPPPKGSLKYRVKLINFYRDDPTEVKNSIENLVNCFGTDTSQSVYVKYTATYCRYYSQNVYINFSSEDDIIMLSPFINDSCWHEKTLEIYKG